MQLFAAHQCDLQFGAPALVNVHLQGHNRPLLLGGGNVNFSDLLFVQQQLAGARLFVVIAVALHKMTDVDIHQPGFTPTHQHETILQIDLARPHRFDFGAGENDASFVGFLDKVFKTCLAIGGNDTDIRFLLRFA